MSIDFELAYFLSLSFNTLPSSVLLQSTTPPHPKLYDKDKNKDKDSLFIVRFTYNKHLAHYNGSYYLWLFITLYS